MMQRTKPLSLATFNVMLALSLKPQHGYGIMQQVKQDTGISIGPGTLYGTVKQLRETNLIEELPFAGSERQRHYRLTKKGWDTVINECERYAAVARLARKRHLTSDTEQPS